MNIVRAYIAARVHSQIDKVVMQSGWVGGGGVVFRIVSKYFLGR